MDDERRSSPSLGIFITMSQELVAYYRVSTDAQGLDGYGIAAQRDAVESYAIRTGTTIVGTYQEVETARKDRMSNRPELRRAAAHARRSKAVLVIARIDRLARSVLVTAELLASGVDFLACDNLTPTALRSTSWPRWRSTRGA